MRDDDPAALTAALAAELDRRGIAFMELVEDPLPDAQGERPRAVMDAMRRNFRGPYIANRGYDGTEARAALERGDCELVSFGKAFISNPDLPRRLRERAPLNEWNVDTFYGGGARGYTDYPALPGQAG